MAFIIEPDENYNSEYIENALKNPADFKNYFPDAWHLAQAIDATPSHSQLILKHILNYPNEFEHYFPRLGLLRWFKDDEKFCEDILNFTLNDDKEFKRLCVDNSDDFYGFIRFTSASVQDKILTFLLNNPDKLKSSLKETHTWIPYDMPNSKYAELFKIRSLDAVITEINKLNDIAKSEINSSSQTLYRDSLSGNSLFSNLPDELLVKIAKDTTTKLNTLTEKEKEEMAYKNLSESPKKK